MYKHSYGTLYLYLTAFGKDMYFFFYSILVIFNFYFFVCLSFFYLFFGLCLSVCLFSVPSVRSLTLSSTTLITFPENGIYMYKTMCVWRMKMGGTRRKYIGWEREGRKRDSASKIFHILLSNRFDISQILYAS